VPSSNESLIMNPSISTLPTLFSSFAEAATMFMSTEN
jgi:hypothetical protein